MNQSFYLPILYQLHQPLYYSPLFLFLLQHRNESPEVPTEIPPPPTCTLFSEEIPTEIFDLFEEIVQSEASNEIQKADPSKSSRFQAVPDADVDKFNQDHENDNTQRKTLGHIKLLTQYLVQNGENRQIHEIPPLELDALLCKFIIGVRRKNGEEYEPSYLRGMFGSFERYLKRHKYSTSLIKGHDFSRSKQTLRNKQKKLKNVIKGLMP